MSEVRSRTFGTSLHSRMHSRVPLPAPAMCGTAVPRPVAPRPARPPPATRLAGAPRAPLTRNGAGVPAPPATLPRSRARVALAVAIAESPNAQRDSDQLCESCECAEEKKLAS